MKKGLVGEQGSQVKGERLEVKGDKIDSFEHLEIWQSASQELAQSWGVEGKGKGSKTKSLEPNLSPYTFDLKPASV